MHSLGMGFTVREGVTATVQRAGHLQTIFNSEAFPFSTVIAALAQITDEPLRVDLHTELPLSGGFGLSGASALAACFAANELLELGLSRHELGMAAHVAEVRNLTGLGDVGGQFNGGCMVKLKSGEPLAALQLPVPEQDVYYRYFSPILTKEVIGSPEQAALINAAADRALTRLSDLRDAGEAQFAAYIAAAKAFAEDSRLLRDQKVRDAIAQAESAGGAASMIMLGNAVFSTADFEGATRTRLVKHRVDLVT